jgi:hypothetical protein
MGAGTSASTFIRQGATASCNVVTLSAGPTASFRIRHKGSLLFDFGDGTTQYRYNATGNETVFRHEYSTTGDRVIKIRGCVNLISDFRTGSGGPIQTQPVLKMTQPETAKMRNLGFFSNQDVTANIIFDTTKLPPVMTYYYNAGTNQSYGSIGQDGTSFLPVGLTQFWTLGSAEGHTGSINNLPPTMLVFNTNEISAQNFTGSIDALPSTLTSFSVGDTNSSITGDIGNLPLGMAAFYLYGSPSTQTITGDLGSCLNARPNLRTITVRGANTISCNFATFSPPIGATGVDIALRGNSSVSGNINQMTNNIKTVQFVTNNFNLSGDIAYLPQAMTSFYASGTNSQIITGDLSSLSLSGKQLAVFLINSMPNHTVGGNLSSIPPSLTTLNVSNGSIYGSISSLAAKTKLINVQLPSTSGSITGDITTVGPYIRSITIAGANVSLTGDIGLMPPLISTLVLSKGAFSYTSPRVWSSTMGRVRVESLPGFGLSTSQVDNILIDLAQYATNWSNPPSSREILLNVNNAPRSSVSDAAKTILNNRGVTVLTAP